MKEWARSGRGGQGKSWVGGQWCPKAFHVYNICQVRKRKIPRYAHEEHKLTLDRNFVLPSRVMFVGNAWQRRRQPRLKLLWFDIRFTRVRTCMILFHIIDKGVKVRVFTLLLHANAWDIKQSDFHNIEWSFFKRHHHSRDPTVSLFQKSNESTLYLLWFMVT